MSAIAAPIFATARPSVAARRATVSRGAVVARPAKASVAMRKRVSLSRPSFVVRAEKTEKAETAFDSDEIIKTLQEKWDETENKSQVFVYGGAAVVGLWVSSTMVGAINGIPLLPKVMELVGLGYTSWFVYRYLLFKSSRKDLIADVEELKAKIAGDQPDERMEMIDDSSSSFGVGSNDKKATVNSSSDDESTKYA